MLAAQTDSVDEKALRVQFDLIDVKYETEIENINEDYKRECVKLNHNSKWYGWFRLVYLFGCT